MKKIVNYLANTLIIVATLCLTACQTMHASQNSLSKTSGNWIFSVENQQTKSTSLLLGDNKGNVLQTLAQIPGKISGLTLSFDKRYLLYTAQQKSYPQVYVLDLKTKQQSSILSEKTNYFGVSLSPDNQKLLFSATLGDSPEIFIKHLHNQTQQNLTQNGNIDISPVWFSHGKAFLFSSDDNPQKQPKLYHYQLDSEEMTQIASYNYETNVRISPTNRYITFFSKMPTGWQNLLMDLQTKAVITVRDDKFADYVNFSPDGEFLLYPYYHNVVVLPVPELQNGTFQPILQKNQITIKGLNQYERIKEVVWLQ